jgi:eukaryotic-like serine/threonine-protein kinase
MDFVPGALIAGRYRLKQMVGAGGMGEVWAGEDSQTRSRVALKRLLPAAAKHHEVVARFKREAYLLGKVESAYVAKVRDFFDDETFGLVLVMDFIEGPSLANVLEERTLTVEEAIELSVDLLRALVDLHGANIVHRDLKPGNIIMRPLPDGGTRAMIVDFGISRLVPSKDEEVTGITRANIALGTVEYMAPEQILNSRDVTAVTDLYAVGIILFRAVKGHHAFGDRRGEELARAKLIEDAPALVTSRRDELADGLSALVARALKKKPSQRFPSAREMLVAADALAQRAAALSDMEDTTTDGGQTAVKRSPLADAVASRPSAPPPPPKPRPPTPRPAAGRPAAPVPAPSAEAGRAVPPARVSSPGTAPAPVRSSAPRVDIPNALGDEPTRAKPPLEDRARAPLPSVPEIAPIGVAPEPSRPPSPRSSLPSIPDFGDMPRDPSPSLGPTPESAPVQVAAREPDPRRSLSDSGGAVLGLQPPAPPRGVVLPWAMLALGFVTTLAVGAAVGLALAPTDSAHADCAPCTEAAAPKECAESSHVPASTAAALPEATATPTSSAAAGTASATAKASAKPSATATATAKAVLTGKLQPTATPTGTNVSPTSTATSTAAPTATTTSTGTAPTATATAAPKPTSAPPTDPPPSP